jgi:hypothetical protein
VLDRAEQVVVIALFCLLTWRVFDSANPLAPALLLSEGAVAFFVLIRRPTQAISIRLGDWLLATTATMAPLLVCRSTNRRDAGSFPPCCWWSGTLFQLWSKLVLRQLRHRPRQSRRQGGGPYRLDAPSDVRGISPDTSACSAQSLGAQPAIYAIGGGRRCCACWPRTLLSEDELPRVHAKGAYHLIPGVLKRRRTHPRPPRGNRSKATTAVSATIVTSQEIAVGRPVVIGLGTLIILSSRWRYFF